MHEDQVAETEAAPVDPAPPPQPGWMMSPTCVRLRMLVDRYETRHGRAPAKWLMSPRIARQVVEELRPLLRGDEQVSASVDDLTGMFGVPIELVADLPQGAVLR